MILKRVTAGAIAPAVFFCLLAAGSRLQYAMYVLQVENRGVGGVALYCRVSSDGVKILVTIELYVKAPVRLCVIDVLRKLPVAVAPDVDFPCAVDFCAMQAACFQTELERIAVFYFGVEFYNRTVSTVSETVAFI